MIVQINQNTWRIDEKDVRFFLLEGEKDALLVDTGKVTDNAKELAETLTSKPVKLLNTHADLDHIRSNFEFEQFYMHPAEACNYYKRNKGTGTLIPVEDKQIIDLGGRPLEVITLCGHTPGSIGLLDLNSRALFCGDVVAEDYNIFLFGWHREIHAYLESLKKLEGMLDRFDIIYPSHGTPEVKPAFVSRLRSGIEKVIAGEVEYGMAERYNTEVRLYDIGVAGVYCDK